MSQDFAGMRSLAARLVASGTPGTLTTLFSARGSTYRPVGSMMASLPGMHAGGISGGCLEEYVARIGERATRNEPAIMLRFDTHRDAGDDMPVLGCGGSIELLIERLTPDHVTLLEQFAAAAERDEDSWLASVVARAGDGVSVMRTWLGAARGCHVTSQPDVLVQHVPPLTRLIIFGAGDDAQPLCEAASLLGWHVSVADRRARLATRARFPKARQVVAGDWESVIETLTFSSRTAAVLMTHDLDDDAQVLSRLPRTLPYVGALGPAHRREWLLEEASSLGGVARHEQAPLRVRGPIGLDLGDRSPAGIAVAVVAEILAQLNWRTPQPLGTATDVLVSSDVGRLAYVAP